MKLARTGRAVLLGAVLSTVPACPEPGAPRAPAAAPPAAVARSDAAGVDALHRIAAAEKSVPFVGYKHATQGPEGESRSTRMRVARYADGRTMLEWRGGSDVTRRWSYKSRFAWLKDPDLLLRNYVVRLHDQESRPVAWRPTRRVTMTSPREGRPSLELLVDAETWLPLREVWRDAGGQVWLQSEFESIEYRAPEETPDVRAEALALPSASSAAEVPELPLAILSPPEGFVRLRRERTSRGALREEWTDGLAAFSVTEATLPADPSRKEGEVQRRQCRGRTSVTGVFDGVEVTLLGTLSSAEMEKVIRSLSDTRAPAR